MTSAIICGGRDYSNVGRVRQVLDRAVANLHIDTIIEGGAAGADTLAREYAIEHELSLITIKADWEKGNRAGPIRNMMMLAQKPDYVIGFPGGSGTAHMLSIARRAEQDGAHIKVFSIEDAPTGESA